jgi:predicted amidohydrolase
MERFFVWLGFLQFPLGIYICYEAWYNEDVVAFGAIILVFLLSCLNSTLEAISELIGGKE